MPSHEFRPQRSSLWLIIPQVASLTLPLLQMVILALVATADDWVGVGYGYAVAALVAAFWALGWNINGATRVAENPEATAQGINSRIVFSPLAFLIIFLAALFTPDPFMVALVAVGSSLASLSLSWVTLGTGDARLQIAYETLPRALGLLTGSVAAMLTESITPLFAGPCILQAASFVALAVKLRAFTVQSFRSIISDIRFRQWPAIMTTVSSALPPAVVPPLVFATTSTEIAAAFVILDRLFRVAANLTYAVTAPFQSAQVRNLDIYGARFWGRNELRQVFAGVLTSVAFIALAPLAFKFVAAEEPATTDVELLVIVFSISLVLLPIGQVMTLQILASDQRSKLAICAWLAVTLGVSLVCLGAFTGLSNVQFFAYALIDLLFILTVRLLLKRGPDR